MRHKILRLPVLVAVVLLAIGAGNLIVKNFLATSLIAYGEDEATRSRAAAYAPANPEVAAARGKFLLYRAEPPRPGEGIAELERAARLSPRDYRFALELGRAYEEAGDPARAEAALARAAEMAPRYFDVRWARGNFLLRAGRTDAALDEFRLAIRLSGRDQPNERAQLNIYQGIRGAMGEGPELLRRVTPPDEVSQSYLAGFYAAQGRLDPAMEIWRRLPESSGEVARDLSVRLLEGLQTAGRFAEEREVWGRLERMMRVSPAAGLVTNEGFERAPLAESLPALINPMLGFDWILRKHPEVRVNRTRYDKYGGGWSLQLTFPASMSAGFDHATQLIAIEPGRNYRLSFFAKRRNISLEESRAPYVELSDAIDPARLTLRIRLPAGEAGWTRYSADFAAPAGTRGVRVSIRCPQVLLIDPARITEAWFDDFNLEPISE
ncbi:MAG: tetratricopeptide repeat protein [Blastocatellia bacterium]